MLKPAIVIGLGGTGTIVLRHLKAQILDSKKRILPPQIKLIGLDTAVIDERRSPEISGERSIMALRTELDPDEYHWIGGNTYDFVRQVDRGEHPHIESWFQARTYLENLPRASFALERGAGQLRQFGRLALFYDVSAPARSSIYNLFNRAISDIHQTGVFQTIEVFLISSAIGATGSGMFIDIAHLVRQIAAQDHMLAVRLRGFLVLPEAFGAVPGGTKASMRAFSHACMRENSRFMVDLEYQYGYPEYGYPMYYHSSGKNPIWHSTTNYSFRDDLSLTNEYGDTSVKSTILQNITNTKMFDFLYYIDGQSLHNNLTHVLPEYGVTPAISDIIAAMLESPSSGEEDFYTRHQTHVISQVYQAGIEARFKDTPMVSAFGVFSIELPMHQIIEWLAHRLVLEALDTMLRPIQKDEDGYPTTLATDANAEMPGLKGQKAATQFLEAAEVQSWDSGERVASTSFYHEVARIARNYTSKDQSIVKELSSRRARDWEMHLDPPGTTPEIVFVRQRVQQELNRLLTNDVPPNQRGESAGSAVDRIIRGVEAFKDRYLGREDMRTGQRVGGQYHTSIGEYIRIQLERYRQLLQIECENILNGGQNPNERPLVHKGGKLGYLLDWLDGLEEVFNQFLAVLYKATEIKSWEKRAAISAARAARQELEEKPGGFFASRRRQHYLDAEQNLIEIEKTSTIQELIYQLVQTLSHHTKELHEIVQGWAAILGIGFNSIYASLQQSERRIMDEVKAEQRIPVREVVWDQGYLQDLYEKYTRGSHSSVDDYLALLSWRYIHLYQQADHKVTFGIKPFIQVSEDGEPNQIVSEKLEHNLELMLTPARQMFADIWERESILKYLRTWRYTNPNTLGDLLATKTEAQLNISPTPVIVPANYLHIAHENDPSEHNYLNELRSRLEMTTQASGRLNSIVYSNNRFKLCLVHTLDFVPAEEIVSYKASVREYWDTRNRETLHIFPAEVNAVPYEQRIMDVLKRGWQTLHPRVVTLLEYPELVILFIRAYAYNLVRKGKNKEGEDYFYLYMPAEEYMAGTSGTGFAQQILLTRPGQKTPDLVEALFTFVYRQRDIQPNVDLMIDFDRVERACTLAGQGVGEVKANVSLLEAFLSDKIIPLKEDATNQIYRDLGAVLHIIILDEIARLTELGHMDLESFSALWSVSETPNYLQHLRSFCHRLAKECGIELTSHEVKQDKLYLVEYKMGSLFQEFPSFPETLPLIFSRERNLSSADIDHTRQLLQNMMGSVSQVAIFIVFADAKKLREIRNNLFETMGRVYAYDIIVPAREDLMRILASNNAREAFRKFVLSQVALTTVSPFIITGATSDEMFFGREKELRELTERAANTSYIIIGGRRIGKTSMLRRLHRIRLPATGIRTIYHDCSTISNYEAFLTTSTRDWQPDPPPYPSETFGDLLKFPPDEKPLVLLLDEADKIVPTDCANGWPLFSALRALANSGKTQVILSGERTLRDALRDPKSPLFNFANEMLLGPLNYSDVEELVVRPMKQLEIDLIGEKLITGRIWSFTSGHPNVVQRLCRRLIGRLNIEGRRSITEDDVKVIIEDPAFQREDFLSTYWEATTALEKIISLVMADDNNVRTLASIRESLANRCDLHPRIREIDEALQRLVDLRSILNRTPTGYEFAVKAFPRVVAGTMTLDDMLEILTEEYLEQKK